MSDQGRFSRRTILETAAAAGVGLVMSGPLAKAQETGGRTPGLSFTNEQFYGPDGKFNVEAGKDAIIKLMEYHKCPVFKDVRERLWVSDYGLGQFTKLGLAARMWVNNEQDHYMLMDIYLLPGQMLPEHWHEKPEANLQKLEGWLVRYGLSHIVGEGEPNLGPGVVVPKLHMGGEVTTKHEVAAGPGDFVPLSKAGTRHWQLAGPEGAIITEVANVHTNTAVRHSDQKANDNFLGK